MPRYIVQRTFPGLAPPGRWGRADLCPGVAERSAEEAITWISSFVSEDQTRTFCGYDAPTPEAIRKAVIGHELPVDQITQVRVPNLCIYA